MRKRHLVVGALIALPLLVGGGAAAFAASGSSGTTSPGTAFIADVASHLGISTSTLQGAMKQAELDRVQQAVKSGKLTSAQASKIEARINSGKLGPGFGALGGRHPMRPGIGGALQAAATYLGVTPQQLRADLRGGQSLSDVAAATSGKSVQGLEAAITSSLESSLQQAVTAGRITQQQAQTREARLQPLVQRLVTRTGHAGAATNPPAGN